MKPEHPYTILCLGDSYTIGESVEEKDRFPVQLAGLLGRSGIVFDKPVLIAKTSWTTGELSVAIKEKNLQQKYDYVTLLIGVNNQFRGGDLEEYRKEFNELLNTAIHYAGGNRSHVFVISIPDWGVTPFAGKDPKRRTPEQISKEIDRFNAVNKEEAVKSKVNYADITPLSREAKNRPELIAADVLHPSGKMYTEWAQLLAGQIRLTMVSK